MNLKPDDSQLIKDSFGRIHNNLRISVTDRCNIRCTYCMPENAVFLPRKALLTFEEIERFVKILAANGLSRIRLTGGEPLVRKGLPVLINKLKSIRGIEDIALTTNGILLRQQAVELKQAGLSRLNISLDTLDQERFFEVSRRDELPRVLDGIEAAIEAGFQKLRLNTVSIPLMTCANGLKPSASSLELLAVVIKICVVLVSGPLVA